MEEIAREIRTVVDRAAYIMSRMNHEKSSLKVRPDKWSKKEILGHMIDSAANNHQRFVRVSCNDASAFPSYDQTQWVEMQRYNESNWDELIVLWTSYNSHLSNVVGRIPQEAQSLPCQIGTAEPVTLLFVAEDYLRHMRHHISQILEETV
jgi:hypothetical protein